MIPTASDASTAPNNPSDYARTLTGIRTITVASHIVVRAAVDWLLRPGARVYAADQSFIADYVSYWVSPSDRFMDAGRRSV